MPPTIDKLMARICRSKNEIEQEFKRKRTELNVDCADRRLRFEREALEQQQRSKLGLTQTLQDAAPRNMSMVSIIYAMVLPLRALDFALTIYRTVNFSRSRVPRVRRRDNRVFDRAQLGPLNLLEKINCADCSYTNGVAACEREVLARTAQHGCSSKHVGGSLPAAKRR